MFKEDILYIWYTSENHEESLCLVFSKKIFCISIERLNKIKETNLNKSIEKISKLNDLDLAIKYFFNDEVYFDKIIWINIPNNLLNDNNILSNDIRSYQCMNHHLSHAYSSYFATELQKSAILVIDWSWYNDGLKKEICQAILIWEWNKIDFLNYQEFSREKYILWIWESYAVISELIWLEPWSVMWLSAYWNSSRFKHIDLFEYVNWNVLFNTKYIKENELSSWHEEVLFFIDLFWVKENDYIKRQKDITTSIFADIAAKLQEETEEAIIYLANKAYELTKSDNLCFAWWVALNILANSRILKETKFKNVFVWPWASDYWIWLWLLYYGYNVVEKNEDRLSLNGWFLWKEYSENEMLNTLKKYKKNILKDEIVNYDKIGELLSEWKIIWWFQWWSEFWQRSLWNRSILASPTSIEIRDKVNKIKSRQLWRPLAPSILEEYLEDYFDTDIVSPYMTLSWKIVESKLKDIPGVVHVDGTSRYHTVNSKQNEKFYSLLKSFYKQTKVPILINTSFNVKWQPIVETPEDAMKVFLSTDLDYLVIWNHLISKDRVYNEYYYNKEFFMLTNYYNNEKLEDLYIKKRRYLWKLLFWVYFNDDFIFNNNDYYYALNIDDSIYQICLTKNCNWWEWGCFFKYNNLELKLISNSIWENLILDEKIIKILEKVTSFIEFRYEKIYRLF